MLRWAVAYRKRGDSKAASSLQSPVTMHDTASLEPPAQLSGLSPAGETPLPCHSVYTALGGTCESCSSLSFLNFVNGSVYALLEYFTYKKWLHNVVMSVLCGVGEVSAGLCVDSSPEWKHFQHFVLIMVLVMHLPHKPFVLYIEVHSFYS